MMSSVFSIFIRANSYINLLYYKLTDEINEKVCQTFVIANEPV
jgi:hypothetical protein